SAFLSHDRIEQPRWQVQRCLLVTNQFAVGSRVDALPEPPSRYRQSARQHAFANDALRLRVARGRCIQLAEGSAERLAAAFTVPGAKLIATLDELGLCVTVEPKVDQGPHSARPSKLEGLGRRRRFARRHGGRQRGTQRRQSGPTHERGKGEWSRRGNLRE